MVAVPEVPSAVPVATRAECTSRLGVPVRHRRAVAIAPSAMELFRPESDLARLLQSFQEVDLLLATDDPAAQTCGSVHVLGPSGIEPYVLDEGSDDEGDAAVDGQDDVQARASALDLTDLKVHRLGLRHLLGPSVEAVMVAGMSELVGFDPEPGVYCLAPSDSGRTAAGLAAQRIAQVYGIPLLRYRCLELSVVGES